MGVKQKRVIRTLITIQDYAYGKSPTHQGAYCELQVGEVHWVLNHCIFNVWIIYFFSFVFFFRILKEVYVYVQGSISSLLYFLLFTIPKDIIVWDKIERG